MDKCTLRNRLEHAALRKRVDYVHDLFQQHAFCEELHAANRGEPVSERFLQIVLEMVHEEPAERKLLVASGLHPRLGAQSPLQYLDQDLLRRICDK